MTVVKGRTRKMKAPVRQKKEPYIVNPGKMKYTQPGLKKYRYGTFESTMQMTKTKRKQALSFYTKNEIIALIDSYDGRYRSEIRSFAAHMRGLRDTYITKPTATNLENYKQ